MKITCHSCGAKYAIADEKVRGRRVKVRCKGCKTAIVVDGYSMDSDDGGGLEDDDATRVQQSAADMGGGASADPNAWSVNLSDTDQRNMTTAEIVESWHSGSNARGCLRLEGGHGRLAAHRRRTGVGLRDQCRRRADRRPNLLSSSPFRRSHLHPHSPPRLRPAGPSVRISILVGVAASPRPLVSRRREHKPASIFSVPQQRRAVRLRLAPPHQPRRHTKTRR